MQIAIQIDFRCTIKTSKQILNNLTIVEYKSFYKLPFAPLQ